MPSYPMKQVLPLVQYKNWNPECGVKAKFPDFEVYPFLDFISIKEKRLGHQLVP